MRKNKKKETEKKLKEGEEREDRKKKEPGLRLWLEGEGSD